MPVPSFDLSKKDDYDADDQYPAQKEGKEMPEVNQAKAENPKPTASEQVRISKPPNAEPVPSFKTESD